MAAAIASSLVQRIIMPPGHISIVIMHCGTIMPGIIPGIPIIPDIMPPIIGMPIPGIMPDIGIFIMPGIIPLPVPAPLPLFICLVSIIVI